MPPSCALPVLRAVRAGDGPDAFAECARESILLGGCSSSRAAVACGLVGAAGGVDALPEAMVCKLHDAPALLRDALDMLV